MAVRFALANNSLWSSGATWDDGVGPLSGDTVHPNGYTIIIDTDINVASLNNNVSSVYLPNMSIPLMTSNNLPSGQVNASVGSTNAFYAFDQNSGTIWNSGVNNTGWISYQFQSQKTIKRFRFVGNANGTPKDFVFQGSNNGTDWTPIEAVLSNLTGTYLSGAQAASNTTGFTYYRLNVTAAQNTTNTVQLNSLEMTESTGSTYGATAGGTFTVPSTLVGTRTITQNGDGIITAVGGTCVTIAALSGATVNFNVSGSGYIFNLLWNTAANAATKGVAINGGCTVNFNGDIYGSTQNAAWTQSGEIWINSNATVNINGNIYPNKGYGSGNDSYQIQLVSSTSNAAVLNINGNILASNYEAREYNIFNNSTSTVNINGNLSGSTASCYNGGGFLNIPSGIITVVNASSSPAIRMSSGLLTVNGPIINVGNASAILAYKMRFYSGQTAQWTVQDTTNANITLSSIGTSGVTIGLPLSGDVRYLTTYGQNNEYVGSLRVPTIDNVRKGVQTDFTVGTADLTANDIFNAISGSTNSVAVRLRNVSTVQSAGDQIAGLS